MASQHQHQAFLGDLVALGDLGVFSATFSDFLGRRTGLMFGRTPPCAIVTPARSFPSSSSFLTASNTCLGIILFFLLSLAALPANSRTCQKLKCISNSCKHGQIQGNFTIFYTNKLNHLRMPSRAYLVIDTITNSFTNTIMCRGVWGECHNIWKTPLFKPPELQTRLFDF